MSEKPALFQDDPPQHHEEHHIRELTELGRMYEKIKDAPGEGA
jgi:hypothetical protein